MSATNPLSLMKKIVYRLFAVAALAAVTLFAACDSTHVDETIVSVPVIESFTPQAAPVGSQIVITGQFLNAVSKAEIGGVEVTIKERVSDTQLSIIATADARDGVIKLYNMEGVGASAEPFTYTYAAPEITATILQSSVDMGDQMLIAGKYMSAVDGVLFTAEGYETAHEATIITRSASELVVKCPYVEAETARITLRYFDGSAMTETAKESAPTITVVRYKPQFDEQTFVRTDVGRSVTLTGSYLDKVDKILVNGFEAQCFKSHSELKFTVPAGDFVDGETVTELKAVYFDGYEELVLSDAFLVYVPFVKYWENMRTWGHSKLVEQMSSFFSPETGIVYANADWRTVVDPIAYQYQASTCSAVQVSNVSVEEYNSVAPYFYFYCNNSCDLSVNSPASSNGLFKNFWIANVSGNENRLPGANSSCYGTPVLAFRALKESNPAEKELADKVRKCELTDINPTLFPADVTAQTIGGIGVSSSSAQLKDKEWAADMFGDKKSDVMGVKPDAVVLVMYYAHPGPEKGADGKFNFASNLKRIGFLHITNVNFVIDQSNSSKPASMSDYTFNCYWQKYDYDYSKIQ